MAKREHHRKPRYLRAIAIVAWALQGIITPWTQTPAHADSIRLGVRAGSRTSPLPIADLLASPNLATLGNVALTWTAPQGHSDIPNVTVSRYVVHYASFSVDSLLGNTTAWWNASAAQETILQPPGQTPQSPGSLDAHNYTGLATGTTYYFGIRSINESSVLSAIDTLAGTPGQQASAFIPAAGNQVPVAPNGVLSTVSANGLDVTLSWTPVTRATTGGSASILQYLIYRYSALASTPLATITIPGNQSSYTENTGGIVAYYRIQAISVGGTPSSYSDYLDSSLQANRYALASDDITTRVVMPHEAARYLIAANNPYNVDLYVTLTHQPQDETNVTLRSYRIRAHRADNDVEVPQFTFPQNNIAVELGYGGVVTPSPSGPVVLGSQGPIPAAVLAQIISIYWYNGSSFIRIGNPLLTLNQSLSVSVRNLGTYQIRAVTIGSKFRLAQGSPYPRVITPNGSENRRVFWFFDNPSGDPVQGDIYDIRGAKVRALRVNGMSPTPNSLVWDGRDEHGAVVPSGVYLYKISTPEDTITGTVVVAR